MVEGHRCLASGFIVIRQSGTFGCHVGRLERRNYGLSTLGGVALTALFAGRSRKQDAEERAEARRAAHDLWIRQQRADAYVGLLDLMSGYRRTSPRTLWSLSRTGTFDEVSPPPPTEQQTAILARVNAYAHPSITEKATAWHRLTQEGMALTSWLRANRTDANARTKLENLDEQIVEAFDQVGKAREL